MIEIQKLISKKINQSTSEVKNDDVIIASEPKNLPKVPSLVFSLPENLDDPAHAENNDKLLNSQSKLETIDNTARKRAFTDDKQSTTTDELIECIVLTDSDDEDSQQPSKKLKTDPCAFQEMPSSSSVRESIDSTTINENTSSTQLKVKQEKPIAPPKRRECENTSCSQTVTCKEKAPRFALSILSIPIKKTPQYLCEKCIDESISIIEVRLQNFLS